MGNIEFWKVKIFEATNEDDDIFSHLLYRTKDDSTYNQNLSR